MIHKYFISVFCSFLLKVVTSDVILFSCLVVYFAVAEVRLTLLIELLGIWSTSVRDAGLELVGGVSNAIDRGGVFKHLV